MRIGIDLGGTKIEIVTLDEAGEVLYRKRVQTPAKYRQTLNCLTDLVEGAEQRLGQRGTVGLGMKGSIDAKGQAKVSNTCINGKPFVADLQKLLNREIRIANDASCFALSEAVDGAGAGHRVVFGVILGTGCGGGLVIDGRIFPGANRIAGEWGHNPMPFSTEQERMGLRDCIQCARPGCIETYLNGAAFEDLFESVSGVRLSGREIDSLPATGDSGAMNEYCHRLARGLSTVINLLDPDVIVVGGGISNNQHIYEKTPPLLKNYVAGGECATPLLKALHGDASGVRGAAWLW